MKFSPYHIWEPSNEELHEVFYSNSRASKKSYYYWDKIGKPNVRLLVFLTLLNFLQYLIRKLLNLVETHLLGKSMGVLLVCIDTLEKYAFYITLRQVSVSICKYFYESIKFWNLKVISVLFLLCFWSCNQQHRLALQSLFKL